MGIGFDRHGPWLGTPGQKASVKKAAAASAAKRHKLHTPSNVTTGGRMATTPPTADPEYRPSLASVPYGSNQWWAEQGGKAMRGHGYKSGSNEGAMFLAGASSDGTMSGHVSEIIKADPALATAYGKGQTWKKRAKQSFDEENDPDHRDITDSLADEAKPTRSSPSITDTRARKADAEAKLSRDPIVMAMAQKFADTPRSELMDRHGKPSMKFMTSANAEFVKRGGSDGFADRRHQGAVASALLKILDGHSKKGSGVAGSPSTPSARLTASLRGRRGAGTTVEGTRVSRPIVTHDKPSGGIAQSSRDQLSRASRAGVDEAAARKKDQLSSRHRGRG